ncbi:ABC transporter ATP-binding protein [Microbispora sp. NPDC049633]|uniref:ABC transporter ATP-binding protein n=1 Tax=Microbispora sp. NPDC049633 TaxID=3154355 RepID=UPI00343E0B84
MPEPVLSCHSPSRRAGGGEVVRALSLDVAPGERVTLVGPSGSGRTTLLTTLSGLLKPAAGRVLVGGVPLAERPDPRRETALVFQSYGLLSPLTAARVLALRPRALPADEPTAEQDKVNRALVLEALLASPAALVVTTHDPEVAGRCDRVVDLRAAVFRR